MAALAPIALFASLAGTAVSAMGTIAAGRQQAAIAGQERQRLQAEGIAAKQAADYKAKQIDIEAKNEFAASQREAQQYGRQKRLALSKLTANAASSGFSATDATALQLGGEIEKYGTLQEQMALYGGQNRQAGMEAQSAATRFSGDTALSSAYRQGDIAYATGQMKKNASYFDATGTILGGIGKFGTGYTSLYPSKPASYRYG